MSMFIHRTGTAHAYGSALRNIGSRQSDLNNLQTNLTSGKKIIRSSDDPTSAANAERARMRISRVATDMRMLETQRNAIATAESTLGDIGDALQRFRELVVNAGNGVNQYTERRFIVNELQGLRDHIFSMANTKDTNGMPLFSSLGSALAPFVGPLPTAPDYKFNGLPGQTAGTDVSIPYTLDGDSAFLFDHDIDIAYNVEMGNRLTPLIASTVTLADASQLTKSSYRIDDIALEDGTVPDSRRARYTVTEILPDGTENTNIVTGPDFPSTSNVIPITFGGLKMTLTGEPSATDSLTVEPVASVFSVLDRAIEDLTLAPNNNNANLAVSQALQNLDIGIGRVSAVRGQAGELLSRADRITTNQGKRTEQLEADKSRAEDLDMIQGISDFNNKQTGYQAALQSYAKVQQLSLFEYMR